jgi:hypothetical protein
MVQKNARNKKQYLKCTNEECGYENKEAEKTS